MGAHLDGAEAAVVHVLAVVSAVGDGTLDGRVGGAAAPVVGTSAIHGVSSRKRKIESGHTTQLYLVRKRRRYAMEKIQIFQMPSSHDAKRK